ncbi:DUF6268 family outer membrane beta-barrel protein [Ulvibacterium marinum]|uniref:DUF6268 domain-containing protein n=1 Tax=Ulvibacterium marinum TaxID=2419782 RepID=A0A3B0BVC5_9FLAO|nr:DUF6268 family outer membrane beta-barrel protein [Ulvibacterium marinum]RKN76962.1 hypothetical protein D7Z94_24605 [Ulvibacterium marinum]
MKDKFPLFLLLLYGVFSYGQLSDLARIEYTLLPKGTTNVDYSRIRALFSYPIKIKEGNYLLFGLDYSNIDLSFDPSIDAFDTEVIQNFQLLDINLGYTFKLNQDWRVGARFTPGFSSNLVKNISLEDVVYSADLVFIKDRTKNTGTKKPSRLILGISYSENRGFPYPIPFVSYYRKFHPKWSYNLGIPRTNLQFHISRKSRLKLTAELDGFTANIQEALLVNGTESAEKVNLSLVVAGMRYEFKFGRNLELFCTLANVFFSNAELLDAKNRRVIGIDKNSTAYLRTGLRFKI